jgi:hypothetical protein
MSAEIIRFPRAERQNFSDWAWIEQKSRERAALSYQGQPWRSQPRPVVAPHPRAMAGPRQRFWPSAQLLPEVSLWG